MVMASAMVAATLWPSHDLANPRHGKSSKDTNIIDIENQISSKIGMKVYINNKRNNSGTLTFEYKDIDQLDRIVKIIKEKY